MKKQLIFWALVVVLAGKFLGPDYFLLMAAIWTWTWVVSWPDGPDNAGVKGMKALDRALMAMLLTAFLLSGFQPICNDEDDERQWTKLAYLGLDTAVPSRWHVDVGFTRGMWLGFSFFWCVVIGSIERKRLSE